MATINHSSSVLADATTRTGPCVGVVIVSYNTRELLRRCLASLEHATLPLRAIVVDNGSVDGSAAMVARDFPAVELIVCARNAGFAGANNIALRRLGFGEEPLRGRDGAMPPDYVLLLNPDAELLPGALEILVNFLEQHPRVAVAAPRLRYPDGSYQTAAFRFPTLLMSLFDMFPPRGPLLGRLYTSPLNGRYPQDGGHEPFPIDHPLGAAMLIRKKALCQVGLLDERYWMYVEEVDWCYRIKRAGWAIWQVPAAEVIHVGGASSSQFRARSFLALQRSRLQFFRHFYGQRFISWHMRILRLAALRTLLGCSIALLRGAADDCLKERMLAAGELLYMVRDTRTPGT
ncbi:MAG: glycosyl transferase [Herpetosiphonaceae bacterium]|nr:MAG: glycosyl transferase [Herpetosiphonaceae bacterium]